MLLAGMAILGTCLAVVILYSALVVASEADDAVHAENKMVDTTYTSTIDQTEEGLRPVNIRKVCKILEPDMDFTKDEMVILYEEFKASIEKIKKIRSINTRFLKENRNEN